MSIDKDKMDNIFKPLDKDGIVGILVHPSPDPDCLGAAAGFSVFLKEIYGLSSKIYHHGEISHPMNKSFKNILHINLENGEEFDPDNITASVVLDTDLTNSGFKSEKLTSVDVRIDHHLLDRDDPATLEDVRATVGSTCTIVWDYLREFGVSLENYSDEATAMVIGIKTDTLDFSHASTSELDMEAFRSLLPLVDRVAMAKIIKYPLPKVNFEMEANAFNNRYVRNAVLVSFVGEITQHNRDTIPSIADRLVRMDSIQTAIIMGIIDNNVVASIRSSDDRFDMSKFCISVFGKAHSGGKEGSGGAKIPLGIAYEMTQGKEAKELIIQEIVEAFKQKIFEELGEQGDQE